jgi:hypothetical protein
MGEIRDWRSKDNEMAGFDWEKRSADNAVY